MKAKCPECRRLPKPGRRVLTIDVQGWAVPVRVQIMMCRCGETATPLSRTAQKKARARAEKLFATWDFVILQARPAKQPPYGWPRHALPGIIACPEIAMVPGEFLWATLVFFF